MEDISLYDRVELIGGPEDGQPILVEKNINELVFHRITVRDLRNINDFDEIKSIRSKKCRYVRENDELKMYYKEEEYEA